MNFPRFHIYSLLLTTGLWILTTATFAQNVFSSEEELKKQANKLFEEEEFGKAYPLFSQLLSLYSKDCQYNYKFGTCLLFSTTEKEKAIPYIEYAAKRQKQGVDKEVFFYLGKAYHLNYRFADAIKSYTIYKSMSSAKQSTRFDVDRQLEMCENGKKLLKSITELSVLEKKEVSSSEFHMSYNLSEFNAKLIQKPEDLKSSIDRKKKHESILYLAPNRNQIYYSSYGEGGKNGKDIYFVTRTPGGELSKATRLSDVINTKYDEDYAFLHPDGQKLYFCSKGHNSMGGYDIFMSEWNSSTQSWGKPVNMDFAINTPDDDILFISDADDKFAYFSSRRESPEGRIMVYKIKLERKPLDLAVITGTLTKTVGDRDSKATITVTNSRQDEVVGVFNTNTTDGSYTLKLPNGGKFMFSIESGGFKKSSELVVIPAQQELKPMKQEITLVNENGQDKIIIKNEFDSEVDSVNMQLAIELIKAKASLPVSPAEEEVSVAQVEENKTIASTQAEVTSNSSVTNTDIIEMAYQNAKETQQETNELLKNAGAAKKLSREKNELSIQKYNEFLELMKKAETLTNQEEKIAQSNRASAIKKEAEDLSKESVLSLNLSNLMEAQAIAKQQQAEAELKYAKDLENAIKAGANETKMNELLARKEDLDKKNEALDTSFPPDLKKDINTTQEQADKSKSQYLEAQQDAEDLQTEAKRLRNEANKPTNEFVKQNLIEQAEETAKEAEARKKDADVYRAIAARQQAQVDSLKNSASLTASVMKEIQSKSPMGVSGAVSAADKKVEQNGATENLSAEIISSKTNADPPTVTSPPSDIFNKQVQEAEKKTNEIEKEEALYVVYLSWADSLDREVALLNKQLKTTKNEPYKSQIEIKIAEVQAAGNEKRGKATDSRKKADNLKLQQALAAASTVVPNAINASSGTNTESIESRNAEPINIRGTENINKYYENELKASEIISKEYERKVKQQRIYEDWSASLYEESQLLKKDGNSSKAEDAVSESKAKQSLSLQMADEVLRIKAKKPELVTNANLSVSEATLTTTSSKTATPSAKGGPTANSTNASLPYNSTSIMLGETAANEATSNKIATVSESTNIKPAASAAPILAASSESGPQGTSGTASEKMLPPIATASLTYKEEFAYFVTLKNEAESLKKNSEQQKSQAVDAQNEADKQFKESQALSAQITNSDNPKERKNIQNLSDMLEKSALKNKAKADSLKMLARNSEAEANSKRTESDIYLQSLDKAAYEEVTTATGYLPEKITSATTNKKTETATLIVKTSTEPKITKPDYASESGKNAVSSAKIKSETQPIISRTNTESATQPVISSSPKSSESSTLPTTSLILPSAYWMKYYDDLFEKLEVSENAYSATNPIPMDAPMPEGLVFKVQIGAFRNPIPQNLFGGIKPITAESTPQGLKRYTAGIFQRFDAANKAKSQVNGLGYKDAFVVAFFNGKRISMNEALEKARASGESITSEAASSIGIQPAIGRLGALAGTITTNATDVKSLSGLFYTIQIGVFTRPVTSTQVYNISPLNSEITDNGLIRYTTGRFDDEAKATQAKNQIVQKGISDAFVIAYRDGKRISLTSAKSMIDSEGSSVITADTQSYSIIPSDTTSTETSGNMATTASNLGIVFKVQVGAFKEQVPIAIANKLLANSNRGIKTFRDDNGLMVYTAGEFLEYESANNLKSQLVNNGLTDAFVIAFKGSQKITASAALEMIRNK